MFGLFKKKVPPHFYRSINARAEEAILHIAGQIEGTRYVLDGGTIDFAHATTREKLSAEFRQVMTALSRNREKWPLQLEEHFALYDSPATSVYRRRHSPARRAVEDRRRLPRHRRISRQQTRCGTRHPHPPDNDVSA